MIFYSIPVAVLSHIEPVHSKSAHCGAPLTLLSVVNPSLTFKVWKLLALVPRTILKRMPSTACPEGGSVTSLGVLSGMLKSWVG
jgi:hypothetical protein